MITGKLYSLVFVIRTSFILVRLNICPRNLETEHAKAQTFNHFCFPYTFNLFQFDCKR